MSEIRRITDNTKTSKNIIRKLFNDTETTKNDIEKIEIKDNKLINELRVKKIITLVTSWIKYN